MILTMANDDQEHRTILVIVIQKDNMERMKQADPISLDSVARGGMLPVPKYPDRMELVIAYEEDDAALMAAGRAGFQQLVRHLARGYNFKPEIDGTEKAELVFRMRG